MGISKRSPRVTLGAPFLYLHFLQIQDGDIDRPFPTMTFICPASSARTGVCNVDRNFPSWGHHLSLQVQVSYVQGSGEGETSMLTSVVPTSQT